jgi:hypothetical protein
MDSCHENDCYVDIVFIKYGPKMNSLGKVVAAARMVLIHM